MSLRSSHVYVFAVAKDASMELLLSRIDNGLELPDEMYTMIASLAHSTGVLCDDCENELANK